MPHYFFHIRNRHGRIEDLEGSDFDTLQAALAEARLSAREILADDLRKGRRDEARLFELEDIGDRLVARLSFSEALD